MRTLVRAIAAFFGWQCYTVGELNRIKARVWWEGFDTGCDPVARAAQLRIDTNVSP